MEYIGPSSCEQWAEPTLFIYRTLQGLILIIAHVDLVLNKFVLGLSFHTPPSSFLRTTWMSIHLSNRNLLTAICRWHCGCIYFVFPMIKWYHTGVVFWSERLLLSQNAKMSLSDDLFEQSYPPESWNRQPRCAIEQINKYCLTHTNWISNLSNVIEEMSLQKDARALKIWRHRCVKNMDVHLYFFKLLCEWVSAFCNEHLIFFFY